MKLKSFESVSGKQIELSNLTVFVGPNNSGKSQTLRGIRERLEEGNKSKPVVIKKFNWELPQNRKELLDGLQIEDSIHSLGWHSLNGISSDLLSKKTFDVRLESLDNLFASDRISSLFFEDSTLYQLLALKVSNLNS